MRHIDEVLRLSAQGLSQHEISRSVGISRTSVRNYLERAQRAELSWPLPENLDSAALEERLFRRSADEYRPGRPEPDWLEVHREHKRGKHVTLQLLHLEYKQTYPDGWGYTQFCTHYHRWLGRQDVVMRLEYAAGERMFVDFAGDTVPITDPDTGEIWDAQIFVSVLGASGYLYAEATRSQEATVEDIDFRTPRGLDRSVIMSLTQSSWVSAHHNLLITGPTGAGKSFIGCALAHAAIRRGHSALYVRTPRLLAELALSRGDGRYVRRLGQLAKIGLLLLDDFLLTPPSVVEAKDLLEVIDDRSQVRSTLVVSQLPVEAWHPALAAGDPTLADAILDRLVHNAHRLPLKGSSMRRRQPEEEPPVA